MVNKRFGIGRGVDALFSKVDSSFFAKLNIGRSEERRVGKECER